MKKLFFACGLLAVTTMCTPLVKAQTTPAPAQAPAPGQGPGGPMRQQLTPEQRADKQTENMQKQLSLTPDQVTKVKQINLDFQTQMDNLRKNNAGGNPQDMHTQMKSLRDKRDTDLKAILTPDQYSKLQQGMQRPPQPGAPATPPKQN